jgi:alanine-glyoxylate transaminase/serine-glyoxylate transaminase/serine-pyruvate transaminase
MTPKVPAGISDMGVRKHLMANYGIEIAGGFGELAGKVFRIGLMGVLATEKDTLFLLEKFEEAFKAQGFEVKGSAVAAAKAVYAAA